MIWCLVTANIGNTHSCMFSALQIRKAENLMIAHKNTQYAIFSPLYCAYDIEMGSI